MTDASTKLHIGAFDQAADGWLNTDITPHIFVSRIPGAAQLLHTIGRMSSHRYKQHQEGVFSKLKYLDIRTHWPFSNGRFSAIYCSHVIEHLFLDEAKFAFLQAARVLRPGGVFRIVVPDIEKIVVAFNAAAPEPFLDAIFENREAIGSKNQHHWGYTAPYLIGLLLEAGFTRALQVQFGHGECPDCELLDNRPEISLYVEAIR